MDFNEPLATLLVDFVLFLPKLIVALITFGVGLFLSGLAAHWTEQSLKNKAPDMETRRLFSRLARWAVLIGALIIALGQVDFDITGFLAGLGVVGLTVGFALQDITKNFMAGLLLLIRQPLNIGDAVKVSNYEGTVMDITTRDTVIKTWAGEMVIIPNTMVFDNPIINYSQLPYRQRSIEVGLGYGQDVARARDIFLAAIRTVEGVAADPAPTLFASAMGDSTLTLVARFWVNQQQHSLLKVHSEVVLALNAASERAQIDLPYPTQVVQIANPGEGPDVPIAPSA